MPDLEIKAGWHDIDRMPPEYLTAYRRFETLIGTMRQEGIGSTLLANVMINLHMRTAADLNPTDEQVDQLAVLFVESVKALRDKAPDAYQNVKSP